MSKRRRRRPWEQTPQNEGSHEPRPSRTKRATRVDRLIEDFFPGWAESRSKARWNQAQYSHAASQFDSAERFVQRDGGRARHRGDYGQAGGGGGSGVGDHTLQRIRERSRDLYDNSKLYAGVLRRAADMLGMPNIMPKTGDTVLDRELREAFVAAGQSYSLGGWLMADGRSFKEAQRDTVIHMDRDGDILNYASDEGIQQIEAVDIETPLGCGPNARIKNGVQVSRLNRPERFWCGKRDRAHCYYLDRRDAVGIDAELCLLVGHRDYISWTRAMPPLQQSLTGFMDLTDYLEAELVGARAAACIMGVISGNDPNSASQGLSLKGNDGCGTDGQQQRGLTAFEPAMIARLYPDEKFDLIESKRPAANFPNYVKMMQRISTLPIGLPLELAFLDFSESNFSTARMIVGEAQEAMKWRRCQLEKFTAWAYLEWHRRQPDIRFGRTRSGVTNYNPYRYEIRVPKRYSVSPEKDALARSIDLSTGVTSITEIAEQMERTVEDLVEEHCAEVVLARTKAELLGLDPATYEAKLLLGVQERLHTRLHSSMAQQPNEEN